MKKYVTPEMEIVLFGDRTGMILAFSNNGTEGTPTESQGTGESFESSAWVSDLADMLEKPNVGFGDGDAAFGSPEADVADAPSMDIPAVDGEPVADIAPDMGADADSLDGTFDADVIPEDFSGMDGSLDTGAVEDVTVPEPVEDTASGEGFGNADSTIGF